MTVVAIEHTLKETVATPNDLLKALQVSHPYYNHSDHEDSFEGIGAFLESWKTYDIDLNRVIRWDIHDVSENFTCPEDMNDEDLRYYGPYGTQFAEIHFLAPRKGYTFTHRIKNLKPGDTPRLFTFLKKHWEHTKVLWDPLPNLEYVPPATPRSRFLDEIQAITERFLVVPGTVAPLVRELVSDHVKGVVHDVLGFVDTDYLLFEKPKSEDQPLDINLNIAGELANYFNEINS